MLSGDLRSNSRSGPAARPPICHCRAHRLAVGIFTNGTAASCTGASSHVSCCLYAMVRSPSPLALSRSPPRGWSRAATASRRPRCRSGRVSPYLIVVSPIDQRRVALAAAVLQRPVGKPGLDLEMPRRHRAGRRRLPRPGGADRSGPARAAPATQSSAVAAASSLITPMRKVCDGPARASSAGQQKRMKTLPYPSQLAQDFYV